MFAVGTLRDGPLEAGLVGEIEDRLGVAGHGLAELDPAVRLDDAVEDFAARLATLASNQNHIVDAPLFLIWVADLAHVHDIGAERNIELDGLAFTETFLIATIDAALAAQNACVAADSLGFSTVYTGALRNHPAEVATELNLPRHRSRRPVRPESPPARPSGRSWHRRR
ncbi:hypothetical protein EOC94_32875 [Mesorhizobium sp. M6A.T.Ce.TU.016.01.1.1]|nr:hypothetical protein EOC94_32875 [Mesorhizobium sp. M6A.T.Ce.TU.016.01.1.1]RWP54523.1 MAG: hypothetical protein EOR07_33930 [Mesorhizobium sp.]